LPGFLSPVIPHRDPFNKDKKDDSEKLLEPETPELPVLAAELIPPFCVQYFAKSEDGQVAQAAPTRDGAASEASSRVLPGGRPAAKAAAVPSAEVEAPPPPAV
jgi:hypothetical protein